MSINFGQNINGWPWIDTIHESAGIICTNYTTIYYYTNLTNSDTWRQFPLKNHLSNDIVLMHHTYWYHTHIHMYVEHVYIYIYIYMWTHICEYNHMYIYIYYTYNCIYIYIGTHVVPFETKCHCTLHIQKKKNVIQRGIRANWNEERQQAGLCLSPITQISFMIT